MSQNLVGVRRTIQDAVAACNIPLIDQVNMPREKQPKAKRKRCYRCSMEHEDRMTVRFCNKCQHPVCAEHSDKEEVFKCIKPKC